MPPAPEVWPVCGADVPRNPLACKNCGADHRSGWRDDAHIYDGTDVPEDAFDYDEFIRQEFGASTNRRSAFHLPHGIHPLWWLTALVLLVAFFVIYFGPLL